MWGSLLAQLSLEQVGYQHTALMMDKLWANMRDSGDPGVKKSRSTGVTFFCWSIQGSRSASMFNSFGADHSISSKWQSAGCTGKSLITLIISIFASSVPFLGLWMWLMAESTFMEVKEQRSLVIPSFTLWPTAWDRSTIRHHLLGWWLFGITLNPPG